MVGFCAGVCGQRARHRGVLWARPVVRRATGKTTPAAKQNAGGIATSGRTRRLEDHCPDATSSPFSNQFAQLSLWPNEYSIPKLHGLGLDRPHPWPVSLCLSGHARAARIEHGARQKSSAHGGVLDLGRRVRHYRADIRSVNPNRGRSFAGCRREESWLSGSADWTIRTDIVRNALGSQSRCCGRSINSGSYGCSSDGLRPVFAFRRWSSVADTIWNFSWCKRREYFPWADDLRRAGRCRCCCCFRGANVRRFGHRDRIDRAGNALWCMSTSSSRVQS